MESKKTIAINLFGGPGAGKSTTSTGIFSLLKLHGVNCEYVPEFAKDLTWEQRDMTLRNQLYIFGKQHHRMWRVNEQVEIIVTDSPLCLGLVYGIISLEFTQVIMGEFEKFDNYNFLLYRVKPYNPKGRKQNEEEAKELDRHVKCMLMGHQIPFFDLAGDYTAINIITERILSLLGKEQVYHLTKKE